MAKSWPALRPFIRQGGLLMPLRELTYRRGHRYAASISPPEGAAETCGAHVRPLAAQLGSFGNASLSFVQWICSQTTSQ